MLKKLILLFGVFFFFFSVSAYTPPQNSSVNITLCSYAVPQNSSVNITLDSSNECGESIEILSNNTSLVWVASSVSQTHLLNILNTSTIVAGNLTTSFSSLSIGGFDVYLNNIKIGNVTTLDSSPKIFITNVSSNFKYGINNVTYVPVIISTATITQTNISYSYAPSANCNYTDAVISIWAYQGKFIDSFGETDRDLTPINTTIGADIWTYNGQGRLIDGVGSSTPYTGSETVANCNITDLAVAMWNYKSRYINGIGPTGTNVVPVNSTIGQAVWGYVNQLKTVHGIST